MKTESIDRHKAYVDRVVRNKQRREIATEIICLLWIFVLCIYILPVMFMLIEMEGGK